MFRAATAAPRPPAVRREQASVGKPLGLFGVFDVRTHDPLQPAVQPAVDLVGIDIGHACRDAHPERVRDGHDVVHGNRVKGTVFAVQVDGVKTGSRSQLDSARDWVLHGEYKSLLTLLVLCEHRVLDHGFVLSTLQRYL